MISPKRALLAVWRQEGSTAELLPNQAVAAMFGKAHSSYACLRIQNDTSVDYCEATSLRTRDTLNVRNDFAFDLDAAKRAARGASAGGTGVGGAEFQTDLHAARRCAP